MDNYTFGIAAAKSIPPNGVMRFWSELLLVGGALVIARYYRSEKRWNWLVGAALFYTLVLIMHNYHSHARNGLDLGIQGRYLFPFLPVGYLLLNKYVLDNFKGMAKAAYVIITLLVFFSAGLPNYIQKTTPIWHTARTAPISSRIKAKLDIVWPSVKIY